MFRRKVHLLLTKVVGLFSLVRGYNLLLIVLAQYLSSIFIFSYQKPALDVLLDLNLFIIVLSSILSIASGYIINNFYDAKKDLINRPEKAKIDQNIEQSLKLKIYFSLNILATLLAFLVSYKAALFFCFYVFLLWFYSHKLKKIVFLDNLTAALLAILPFFGVLMYFKNFHLVIFVHASYLFVILLIRELIKSLENIKGDTLVGLNTIPIVKGSKFSKKLIFSLTLVSIIPALMLIFKFNIGMMNYFFYLSNSLLLFNLIMLKKAESKKDFLVIHFVLKLIILMGVFSITLIDPSVVFKFILN